MTSTLVDFKDRQFIAVIGLLLAGIGHVTAGPTQKRNFLVVDAKTETKKIEDTFEDFTKTRNDIGIVLINQHIANRIRHQIEEHKAAFPTIIEIPSKDHPYDPAKDSIMARVQSLMTAERK
ncbi:hypothetical protein SAPIO_CDS7033 [Scedosporium apiospermum]|uniref:V-type proton ATPase subunit F n=1 Tax=Pseudallescheria apiosperma TaxID=563466 RepID=A0A084G0Z3_PSEDA|nr:uncharacterized protein SAPIO_CDS7033 [Scedosporium apiospermum]KEZ41005.1 hypothetical protein SAPIO_CDS7033 [Scedosporium apiospermum]